MPYEAQPQCGDRNRTMRYKAMDTDIVRWETQGPPRLVCICSRDDAERIVRALNLVEDSVAAMSVTDPAAVKAVLP